MPQAVSGLPAYRSSRVRATTARSGQTAGNDPGQGSGTISGDRNPRKKGPAGGVDEMATAQATVASPAPQAGDGRGAGAAGGHRGEDLTEDELGCGDTGISPSCSGP